MGSTECPQPAATTSRPAALAILTSWRDYEQDMIDSWWILTDTCYYSKFDINKVGNLNAIFKKYDGFYSQEVWRAIFNQAKDSAKQILGIQPNFTDSTLPLPYQIVDRGRKSRSQTSDNMDT